MTKKFLRKKYENSSPSFNNGTKPNNKKKPNKVTEIAQHRNLNAVNKEWVGCFEQLTLNKENKNFTQVFVLSLG